MNVRWPTKRDLLFALAGALIASAVFAPLAWSQIRAERMRGTRDAEELRVERRRTEEIAEAIRQTHVRDYLAFRDIVRGTEESRESRLFILLQVCIQLVAGAISEGILETANAPNRPLP